MKSKMNRIAKSMGVLAVLAVVAMALSSCNSRYFSPVEGYWCAFYNEHGELRFETDYDEYHFNGDGSGYYGYYDDYGNWRVMSFTWDDFGRYVEFYFPDGGTSYLYYQFVDGYLEFSADSYFYSYTGYYRR